MLSCMFASQAIPSLEFTYYFTLATVDNIQSLIVTFWLRFLSLGGRAESIELRLKTIPSNNELAVGPSPPVDISNGTHSSLAITLLSLTVLGPFFTIKDVPSVHTNVLFDTTLSLAVSVNCPG